MSQIRLSPFVSVIPVGPSILIRSDLKSFALSGESVNEFVRRALPLLDGRHDPVEIVRAFPDYSGDSIRALLADLERLGVVETADRFPVPSADTRHEELAAFLSYWGPDRPDMRSALARAHVVVIGSNDWSTIACRELVRSGVGRLTVLDVTGRTRRRETGVPTAARLVRQLRGPGSTTVLSHRAVKVEDGVLDLPFDDVALLVVTANADELPLLTAVAKMAETRRVRYLIAHVDGLSASLGPVVVPGETACWECLRIRRLANQTNFEESALLQAGLLSGKGGSRRSLSPPGAASVLGGLILMETARLVSGFAPSQLVGRQLELNLVTYAARIHELIRLPWCPVCGGAAGFDLRGSGGPGPGGHARQEGAADLSSIREPADLRASLGGWVDDRHGIVRQLVLNDPPPNQPHSLNTATAVIAGPAVPGHHHSDPLIGSGKGVTKVTAMMGAVGEAIERYSASIYRESDLLRASARKLGRRAFDPVALCLYRPEQYALPGFPYDRFDPSQEISWTDAVWLHSGKPVLVPALVAYFNYKARRGEQFCQVTSSGLAAGATLEDATLRATLELIERDAFMMTWLQRRPPRPLAAGEELGADVLEVLAELGELGMDTKLYLMKGDVGIPAVMCVAWGDGKTRPAATVALAAHVDPVEAARKAILEQAHIGPYVARLMADPTQKIPSAAGEVRSLNDHALFYVPRSRLRAFDFIRTARRREIPLERLKRPSGNGIDICLEALAAGGFRVAVADVTSPDVRLGPFRVARALGTYLQPIDFGHGQRRLANPRLGRPVRAINPDPHPLA